MRRAPIVKSRWLPALAVAFAAVPAMAQVNIGRWGSAAPAGPAAQVGPATTSEINASNGLGAGADLHLEFPIFNRTLPNRAQVHATLVYDSLFWNQFLGNWQPQAGAGWWLRTAAGKVTVSEQVDFGACGWTDGDGTDDGTGNINNFTLIMNEPDGTASVAGTVMESSPAHGRHTEAEYWDCPPGDPLPENFLVSDGKGFNVVANGTYDSMTATAYNGFGDNVTDGLADLNGNSMSASSSALSDALGTAVAISGSNPVDYTYTGPNNTPETIQVGYTSVYATANFGCYNSWSGSLSVPSYIQYPDGASSVVFDALGRAVESTYGGTTSEYVYGPGGAKLAVMSGQSLHYALVPLPGGGDAEYYETSGLLAYHHVDHLGSGRLASAASGGLYDSSAYAPFGELYGQTGSDPRFSGQIAAIAPGNYDFLMREYSPTQGRWWTPDPAGLAAVDPGNPHGRKGYDAASGSGAVMATA